MLIDAHNKRVKIQCISPNLHTKYIIQYKMLREGIDVNKVLSRIAEIFYMNAIHCDCRVIPDQLENIR